MPGMSILQLPEETVICIFKHLDFRSLIGCSEACRFFHGIIRRSSSLRYNSELEIAGLVDAGTASSLSTAERLKKLEVIERNWATLSFRSVKKVDQPIGGNIWELLGGVFSTGTSTRRGLSFIELPTLARETPARTWKHDDLGLYISDFSMDPSQDLAVLIEAPSVPGANQEIYSVHLRSMHTGDQHRYATEPILACTVQRVQRYFYMIQIMGDLLGVLFQTPEEEDMKPCVTYVWNWKTGEMTLRIQCDDPDRRSDSFSFLSPRYILLSSHMATEPPSLDIYDLMSSHDIDNPQSVRIFEFPAICDETIVTSILTRSDPSPGDVAAYGGRPFVTAPTARLLTVHVEALGHHDEGVEIHTLMLFVHHDSLLEGIESPGPILVPWEEWGPHKTRLLQRPDIDTSWVCYVHGTRFVSSEQDVNPPARESLIKLLDFNSLYVKRDFKLSQMESSRVTIFPESKPTVIDVNERIFEQTVITTLPYREVVTAEEFGYTAVMIDDECLVGLRRGLFDDESLDFLCI